MKRLLSSDLVRYNANTRGTNTGDCTARAISLAFNIDYSKARKALNDSAKASTSLRFNSIPNVIKVIRELGGSEEIKCPEKLTVGDWADKYNSGTYLIHCNRTGQPHGPGGHLVCIIDGKIYDSWDSRKYYAVSYHTIKSGISSKHISSNLPEAIKTFFNNKTTDDWTRFVTTTFDSIVQKNRRLKKLSAEYNTAISLAVNWKRVNYGSYNFSMDYAVKVSIPKYSISETFSSKIGITFKPTLPVDDIEEYFNSTFASKMHPFINNMSIKAEDILEGEALTSDVANPTASYSVYKQSWDGIVRRSFNNLPYWVRKLVVYFRVEPPSRYGYYNDKVELKMMKPQFDTTYSVEPDEKIYFESESMALLKTALDHYKETGDYEESRDIALGY